MQNNFHFEDNSRGTFPDQPISVSEYISVLNEVLSRFKVKVIGEITEMKIASSGHIYFSLKDEKSGDVINCAIWKSVYKMCGISVEEGMKVVVTGSADIYRARGSLTFKVKTVELAGEGALKKAYEELKLKLEKEGLFSEETKKSFPKYPVKIGLITSKKGAAIHDFINNLGKFGFKVFLCDSRVEGQEAVPDLLRAIKIMKRKDIDVLVIIRGGGSIQSLMAFDNEMIVREVRKSPVPVITGIGHHEDIPLVALAADATESTPTGVANRLSEGFINLENKIFFYERNIENFYSKILEKKRRELFYSAERIIYFFRIIFEKYKKSEEKIKRIVSLNSYLIQQKKEELDYNEERIKREFSLKINKNKETIIRDKKNLIYYFKKSLADAKNEVKRHANTIINNDPKKQLKLGYAIIRKKGDKIIKNTGDIKKGDIVENILSDGSFESKVENIKNQDNY